MFCFVLSATVDFRNNCAEWISTAVLDRKFDLLDIISDNNRDKCTTIVEVILDELDLNMSRDRALLFIYLSRCKIEKFKMMCCGLQKRGFAVKGNDAISYQGNLIDYLFQTKVKKMANTRDKMEYLLKNKMIEPKCLSRDKLARLINLEDTSCPWLRWKEISKSIILHTDLVVSCVDNGIKSAFIIAEILKRGDFDLLEYIITHSNSNRNQFFKPLRIALDINSTTNRVKFLCKGMSKRIDNEIDCIIEYNKLRYAIKHDFDNILRSMLYALIRHQGIKDENINDDVKQDIKQDVINRSGKFIDGYRYHPNAVVTFELVFNLFLFGVKFHGDIFHNSQCAIILTALFNKMTNFNHELDTKCHWSNKANRIGKRATTTNMCILCLEKVETDQTDFIYCNICDYCICAKCFNNTKINHADYICNGYVKVQSLIQLIWQGKWTKDNCNLSSQCFLSTVEKSLRNNDVAMIQYLGSKPPHISNFDQIQWSCLHTIAYSVHPILMMNKDTEIKQATKTLEQLFGKYSINLNKYSKDGDMPIHLACQTNNVLILKIIIKIAQRESSQYLTKMLNTPRQDKYTQHTPLIIAIKNNSAECVELLCKYDCVVENILQYTSRYPKYSALQFACYYSNVNILKLLLSSIIANNDKTELMSIEKQFPVLLQIARRGVANRHLKSSCIKLLHHLASLNANLWSTESKLSVKSDDKPSNETQLTHLNLICFACRMKMVESKILSSSMVEICNLCGQNIVISRFGHCQEFDNCHNVFCDVCIITSSIFVAITKKRKSEKYIYDIVSQYANHDIVQQVKIFISVNYSII